MKKKKVNFYKNMFFFMFVFDLKKVKLNIY